MVARQTMSSLAKDRRFEAHYYGLNEPNL